MALIDELILNDRQERQSGEGGDSSLQQQAIEQKDVHARAGGSSAPAIPANSNNSIAGIDNQT
jgi:hypothetical protein